MNNPTYPIGTPEQRLLFSLRKTKALGVRADYHPALVLFKEGLAEWNPSQRLMRLTKKGFNYKTTL